MQLNVNVAWLNPPVNKLTDKYFICKMKAHYNVALVQLLTQQIYSHKGVQHDSCFKNNN